jgi:hypothetical protein
LGLIIQALHSTDRIRSQQQIRGTPTEKKQPNVSHPKAYKRRRRLVKRRLKRIQTKKSRKRNEAGKKKN